MKTFVKDPQATLDYGFDWGPWLGTDTISNSVWTINQSGLSIVVASETFTTTTTLLYLTGGAENEQYIVTNTISTAASRTDERRFEIVIKQR